MIENKTNRQPTVSIGLPVYNGEKYLAHAIDSILAQGYENFELIISDNASNDMTQQICLSYASRDDRIRSYRNDRNMGPIWNFNRVFELSSGAYFMWACHDDYWDQYYLQSCLDEMDCHKDVILVGTMCRSINYETGELIIVDKGLSTIGLSPFEKFKNYKSIIHSGTYIGGIFYGVFKSSMLARFMPLKNKITIDHLLLSEICFQGDFFTIQKPLMTKRWGGTSNSIKNIASVLGITNRFVIMFPYFDRELILQKIIFKTDKLTFVEKLWLSVWSLWNFLCLKAKSFLRLCYLTLTLLPPCIKRPSKRYLEIVRKLLRKK